MGFIFSQFSFLFLGGKTCRQVMDKEQLKLLHEFVTLCKANPGVLNSPELGFYRQWLERFVYETFLLIGLDISYCFRSVFEKLPASQIIGFYILISKINRTNGKVLFLKIKFVKY